MKNASMTVLTGTPFFDWKILRELSAEDVTTDGISLVGSTYALENVENDVVDLYELFGSCFKGLLLAFYGGTYGGQTLANSDDFDVDIVGWQHKGAYNPPMLLATTTADGCAFGTLASIEGVYGSAGSYYLDSITLSFSDSPASPIVYDSGNNRVAILAFTDISNCQYIYPYISGANGATDGEAPGVAVLATPVY